MMKEYSGLLIGGPDDGYTVETSVAEIPVVSITELWLDGNSTGKDVTIIETTGEYAWDGEAFTWYPLNKSLFVKKAGTAT
jgi:hypothetical protein